MGGVEVVLVVVGGVGLLCMTWGFPLLAMLVRGRWQTAQNDSPSKLVDPAKCIAILLPVYNGAIFLGSTLSSLKAAVDFAKRRDPSLLLRIIVGADGCSDETVSVARQLEVEVVEFNQRRGKLAVLADLVERADWADWIVTVDAGTLWPDTFLERLGELSRDAALIGIAPSYRNPGGGFVDGFLWRLESHFKSLESRVGGPVAVHGATACYRSRELIKAVEGLKPLHWLNDDVVIPFLLRCQNPGKSIFYDTELCVKEDKKSSAQMGIREQFSRRRRMLIGNVQWIKELLPRAWSLHRRSVCLLAFRRIARVFWAYWVVIFLAGIVLAFLAGSTLYWATLLVLALGVVSLRKTGVSSLLGAAGVSFLAPYYFLVDSSLEETLWS